MRLKRRFGGGRDEKDKNMLISAAIGICVSTIMFTMLLSVTSDHRMNFEDECLKPNVTCSVPQGGVITFASLAVMVALFPFSYRYLENKRVKNWRSFR